MWKLDESANAFALTLDEKTLLRHTPEEPMLYIGRGE